MRSHERSSLEHFFIFRVIIKKNRYTSLRLSLHFILISKQRNTYILCENHWFDEYSEILNWILSTFEG